MSAIKLLGVVLLVLFTTPVFAQMTTDSIANEVRLVNAAERTIMIEHVRALSPSTRGSGGSLELAIGLIGVGRSEASAVALVNLLGLQLDGAGSAERSCQILVRGKPLLRHLGRLRADDVVKHCRNSFMDARKRELSQVADVQVNEVCRSEDEILRSRDEFIRAIKSKVPCEE